MSWVVIAALLLAAVGCGGTTWLDRPRFVRFRPLLQRPSTGDVTAWFLGTSSILFRDAKTAILSDGFVSRPGGLKVAFGRIAPNTARVDAALQRLGVRSIAAVFAGHSHYDHAMDAPVFARRTGAVLLGSASTANIARGLCRPDDRNGLCLPDDRIRVVHHGEVLRIGTFELTFLESRHSRPERYAGTIETPLRPPARAGRWKTGTTWSVFVRHERGTALVHGSANFEPGVLQGRRADVVYLGVGRLGKQPKAFVDGYWNEVVRGTRARRVVLVHWDNFFHSLDEPLTPLPVDALDRTLDRLLCRARADHIDLVLPVAWQSSDPFVDLPAPPAPTATPSSAECP